MSNIQDTKRELKDRMARGLNYGIEALEEVLLGDTDLANEFVLYKSKYNDLMHLSGLNTLPYREIELGLDRLRHSLLTLVDRLEVKDIEQEEVKTALTNKALPHRRVNFFSLIDVHYRNLDAINYSIQMYNSERQAYDVDKYFGRDAVFRINGMIRRQYRGKVKEEEDSGEKMLTYFKEYFENEAGLMEVYLKNIRHLISYSLATEIDKAFFLETLSSLLSRYELVLIFYYAVSTETAEGRALFRQAGLWDEHLSSYLIRPAHYNWYDTADSA